MSGAESRCLENVQSFRGQNNLHCLGSPHSSPLDARSFLPHHGQLIKMYGLLF